MNTTTDLPDSSLLDVSALACHEKHAVIFQRWADLAIGEHFVLGNNHDPVGLYFVFAERFPNLFRWEYLERGPGGVKIKITRLAPSSAAAAAAAGQVGCESVRKDGPALNLREMSAAAATVRLLAALQDLPPTGSLRAILDHLPENLAPECDAQGVAHRAHQQADGSWLISVTRR